MLYRHPTDQLRFQRDIEHLHGLGPRALAEFLDELAGKIGGAQACRGLLADYQRISPRAVRSVGGDRFPRRPLHRVEAA